MNQYCEARGCFELHPDLHGAGQARKGVRKSELEAAVACGEAELLVIVGHSAEDLYWIHAACEERPIGMVRGKSWEEGVRQRHETCRPCAASRSSCPRAARKASMPRRPCKASMPRRPCKASRPCKARTAGVAGMPRRPCKASRSCRPRVTSGRSRAPEA